jgi:hypothetical protein
MCVCETFTHFSLSLSFSTSIPHNIHCAVLFNKEFFFFFPAAEMRIAKFSHLALKCAMCCVRFLFSQEWKKNESYLFQWQSRSLLCVQEDCE